MRGLLLTALLLSIFWPIVRHEINKWRCSYCGSVKPLHEDHCPYQGYGL